MKTVFGEMLEQAGCIEGVGAKYVGVALMVAAMDQKPVGTLPVSDDEIAGLIGLAPERWEPIKKRILAHGWVMRQGRWVNKDLAAYAGAVESPGGEKSAAAGAITFNQAEARFEGVTPKRMQVWQEINPAADLEFQLHIAAIHLLDNPKKLSATKNFARFITNWLKKSVLLGKHQVKPLADPIKDSSPEFKEFWGAYHERRRINFSHAAAIWMAAGLDGKAAEVMAGLERWKKSQDWMTNDGEFVPAPDKWLQKLCWLDAPAPHKVSLVRDRSGRAITHEHGNVERDYGHTGSF